MNIAKYFVAISACVISAAMIGLVQGCSSGAPQYSEASPAMTSNAGTQSVGGQGVAQRQHVGAQTALESPESSAAASKERQYGVTGVWHGESRTNCNVVMMADAARCGAVNAITFTLLQNNAKVSGYYRCAYGNMNCRNMNETGRIARGSMGKKLLRMRVMMPDGSDCLFHGWPMGDAMRGSYSCLQGGGLVEQGLWTARRSY